ncbi:Aldehyde dehydrogenase (NAD(+)) [Ascochyta rabiei]|uniref:Aldehyde dehydrogenase (NAD(+)) n=1 Tax=Didymella rabiei TaxID=5454 RepID=UPI002201C0A9|nr:Aldehyde dehydrogenase (NAD(+)) [Ascochyta rabiei]UPX20215.1 Aldehyde dehydrogenase (NAD(+)) [Ascochyta rabiei]
MRPGRAMSTHEIVERIAAAWIEGRLENVLERQKQLAVLHQSLHKRIAIFVRALQQDTNCSSDLATSEIVVALDNINSWYERLDFQDTLRNERNIKHEKGPATFQVPLGRTLIVQSFWSPIISVLSPLAGSLAGGNPTIVLGSHLFAATNKLLKEIVEESLDVEAFHFEPSIDTSDHEAFTNEQFATVVLHSHEASERFGPLVRNTNPSVRLIEPYYGIPAGIIDRSAGGSLDAAFQHINSSLQVSGLPSNPLRIPRLFFVDEALVEVFKKKFPVHSEKSVGALESLLRKHYSDLVPSFAAKNKSGIQASTLPRVENIATVKTDKGAEIILVPTRSLDHTIDLLNKINGGSGAQAVYIFAAGKEAFYLGNFIATSQVYINEIPIRSIVGANGRSAYNLEDFTETKTMVHASASPPRNVSLQASKLNTQRVKQANGGRMSYFEQGLILGLAMGLVALTGIGYAGYRGLGKYLRR